MSRGLLIGIDALSAAYSRGDAEWILEQVCILSGTHQQTGQDTESVSVR
jgi:hypothetical protein